MMPYEAHFFGESAINRDTVSRTDIPRPSNDHRVRALVMAGYWPITLPTEGKLKRRQRLKIFVGQAYLTVTEA
jgi:hypothetical protein